MLPICQLTTAFLLALQLLPTALGCSHLPVRGSDSSNTTQFPDIIPGSNDAADPATTGYFLNHFSLNVRNLTASVDFYTKALGMRIIFNYRATKKLSIVYMAHSQGGRNGTGYQTVEEMNRQKNNMAGLLELVHYDNPNANLVPSTKVTNTFSHLGLIVPDINATQTRLEHYGADILKNLGEEPKMDGEIAFAYGIGDVAQRDPKGAEEIFNSLLKPGSKDFIFVADPDGNYVEVESLYHPQLDLP